MKREHASDVLVSDGTGVSLSVDAWGKLTLETVDGRIFTGVEPIRAFPISDPSGLVAFCDGDGREVFCLRSPDGLEPPSRRVLEEELSLREFLPVIKSIRRVSGETTPADWEVDTDRGRTRFTLDNEDDIRTLGPHRLLITDSRKLRYQIPDTRTLDGHSRRLLERFL